MWSDEEVFPELLIHLSLYVKNAIVVDILLMNPLRYVLHVERNVVLNKR